MTAVKGLFLGLLGGVGVPLGTPTASSVGPNAGFVVGYEISKEKVTLQPEAMVRLNSGAPVLTGPIGVSATWGGTLGAGAYGHLSVPIAMTYPFPGLHAGGLVAYRPGDRFRTSLRVGYEVAHSPHFKCGVCPQPSDHWLAVDLIVGVRFGRKT